MKFSILLSVLFSFALSAQAADLKSSLVFKKSEKVVTYEQMMSSEKGSLGYLQGLVDEEICYNGKDYEIIDMLVHGINHYGNEVCDKYIVVSGTTIIAGPCFMKEDPDTVYQLPVEKCAK